jgi:hypothetical protein
LIQLGAVRCGVEDVPVVGTITSSKTWFPLWYSRNWTTGKYERPPRPLRVTS